MNYVNVSLQVYEHREIPLASGGTYKKPVYAFYVLFPNGTTAWSHDRANVRAIIRDYRRETKDSRLAVRWDCGTYDP